MYTMKRIKQLIKNLIFLSKIDLKEKFNPIIYKEQMSQLMDRIKIKESINGI